MKKMILALLVVSAPALAHETCINTDSGYGQTITQCGDVVIVVDGRTRKVLICDGVTCTTNTLEESK